MRTHLFLALAVILALPVTAGAQSLGGPGDTSSFTLSISPQYPAPNSSASLSFVSSVLDLANATLSVSVGGKNIYQGSVQPVTVTLGKAGSVTNINATVTSAGTKYNQTLRVQPQDVVLVAEPISSAPPLYPGKSGVPLTGSVRVVAMANLKTAGGKSFDPATVSYLWTVDDTQIANSSGIGKSAIMVASPLQYRMRDISVTVTSSDGNLVGGDSLSVSAADPSVRIYENDPLLGILFGRALTNQFAVGAAETTLYAAPFSLPTTVGIPLIQWFLNGDPAQTGSTITLKPTGNGQGSASLSLVASVGSTAKATIDLPVSFGTKSSSSFFGL